GVNSLCAAFGNGGYRATRFAPWLYHLPPHRRRLFKALEGGVQDRIIECDRPAQHLLDAFFDLVTVLWPLSQHGQDHDLSVHMFLHPMLFLPMKRSTIRDESMSRGTRHEFI